MTEDMFSYEILALVKAFYPVESHVLKITEPEGEEDFIFLSFSEEEVGVTVRRDGICQEEVREQITRSDRRLCKDAIKQAVYHALSKVNPVNLPWGTLTGVRPTKLFMELMEQGHTKEEIFEVMQKRYLVSDEKAELGYEIVKKEYELLHYLMLNRNIVLGREQIMERVWGTDFEGESRTLDMHIKTLRQKLGASGSRIRTVRNVGYVIE